MEADIELLYVTAEGRQRDSLGLLGTFHLTQGRLPSSSCPESGTNGGGGVQAGEPSQEGWTCVLLLGHPAAPHM